jgi:endonuclease/exonuclease/phosphatase family metal-dependent hydrolase
VGRHAISVTTLILLAGCIAGCLTGCAHRPAMVVQPGAGSCRGVVAPRPQAVMWVIPDDSRDQGLLARWCRTVGPAVIAVPPAEAAVEGTVGPRTAVADELAVVSWNVHGGGGDVDDLIERLRAGALTDGRPVPQFALLLQEAHRAGVDVPALVPVGSPVPSAVVARPPAGTRRDVQAVAADAGLYLFYVPSMRNGLLEMPEDRGNAILSTLPLSDFQAIELPFERQRRVALAGTASGRTTAGVPWTLRLVSVHLDTSVALTRGGPVAARRRQAEALIEALSLMPTGPTVVAGDFNTWRGTDEPAVDVLNRALPDGPDLGEPTWRGFLGARALLDHAFVRGPLRAVTARRLRERYGSDHHPLLVMLGF